MHITLVLLCHFSAIQLPVYGDDYYHVILYSLCNPAPFSCAILFVKVGVRGSAFVCLLTWSVPTWPACVLYFVWRYPKSVQRSVSPWIWRNGAGKLGRYSWQKEMWRNPSNHVTENKSDLKKQNAWRTEKSTAGLRAYPSTAHCYCSLSFAFWRHYSVFTAWSKRIGHIARRQAWSRKCNTKIM